MNYTVTCPSIARRNIEIAYDASLKQIKTESQQDKIHKRSSCKIESPQPKIMPVITGVSSTWSDWRHSLKMNADHVSPIWAYTDNRITEEILIRSSYIDDFGRKVPILDLQQRESFQPLNTDVPDDLYLFEMGCGTRRNESLDHRQMDDRDFRERCIGVGSQVYALYEKRKQDLAPRSDLRQEVLANMLSEETGYLDIDSLTHVFRDMRLSRKTVLKLVHGYVRPEGDSVIKTDGLKSLNDLSKIARDFEIMNESLAQDDIPEPETNKPRSLDDERAYWLDVSHDLFDRGQFTSILAQIRFIESSAKRDLENGYYQDPETIDDQVIYQNEDAIEDSYVDIDPDDEILLEWDPADEKIAMSIDSNTFSAHPLYDETSCVADEFIDEIKAASWKELSAIKSFLMSKNAWYLNKNQRSISWSFIKGREDQLIEIAMKRPIARLVGSYITKTDNSKRACAMLFAWKSGDRFDTEDTIFKFDQTGSFENELAAAWTIFRREHPEHQKARNMEKAKADYARFSYRDRRAGEKGYARIAVSRQ